MRNKADLVASPLARRRVLSEPLPASLTEAVLALWEEHRATLPLGVTIRPALVPATGKSGRRPQPQAVSTRVTGSDAIAAAIRRTWASAVLSHAMAGYAAAGLRDVFTLPGALHP